MFTVFFFPLQINRLNRAPKSVMIDAWLCLYRHLLQMCLLIFFFITSFITLHLTWGMPRAISHTLLTTRSCLGPRPITPISQWWAFWSMKLSSTVMIYIPVMRLIKKYINNEALSTHCIGHSCIHHSCVAFLHSCVHFL